MLCVGDMYVSSRLYRLIVRVLCLWVLWADVPGMSCGLPDMRRWDFRQRPLLGPGVQQFDCVQLPERCLWLERPMHVQFGLDYCEQRHGVRTV